MTIEGRIITALGSLLGRLDVPHRSEMAMLSEDWRSCVRMFGVDSGPARGALLEVVQLAWLSQSQGVSLMRRWIVGGRMVEPGGEWEVWRTEPDGPHVLGRGPSELEALIAALESAP